MVEQHKDSISRTKREYHGQFDHLSVDKTHTFRWITVYHQYYDEHVELCEKAIEAHADEVLEYGYSLRNLSMVVQTPFLKQFNLLV